MQQILFSVHFGMHRQIMESQLANQSHNNEQNKFDKIIVKIVLPLKSRNYILNTFYRIQE